MDNAMIYILIVFGFSSLILCSAAETRPNIVLILADDHNRQTISSYNPESLIQTPQIDRLAREGMRFTKASVTCAICGPSRAALLTGKYAHLNGKKKLASGFDGKQQTFPKLLKAAGYQTAIIGKWHLSKPTGLDYYRVLPGQGIYMNPYMLETGGFWPKSSKDFNANKNKLTPITGYTTDIITDQSIHWLNEKRDQNKPFCLMVHHKAPHGPHVPAPRHANLFEDTVFPEPATLQDDYEGRAPHTSQNLPNNWSRLMNKGKEYEAELVRAKVLPRDKGTSLMYQAYMKGYLRLVAGLDENIGKLLDHLDASGLSENTIVIYTSDNGFFNGEHGLMNKMWMYKEALHVPLIVRYPGEIAAGSTSDELASMLDLSSTILDYAGIEIPADMQGVSLKQTLQGDSNTLRDAVYYHYYTHNNGVPSMVGIRNATHKLTHYPDLETPYRWELFDLEKDSNEMNNLARNPESAERLERLKGELRKQAQHYKDPITIQ